jgi:RNA polymerase sigma-70 factor (ECF subfamily)
MTLSPEELDTLRRRLAAAVAWVCPDRMASQADDIVQNGMLQLLRLEKRSEGKREFSSTYLKRVAHGVTVDEIRRISRRKEYLLEESGDVDGPGTSMNPAPDSMALSTEIGAAIRACLQKLVRGRRLAVTLYLQGCTIKELALSLGWTPKRADNLVYRGLADLRRCLTRKGITP